MELESIKFGWKISKLTFWDWNNWHSKNLENSKHYEAAGEEFNIASSKKQLGDYFYW